MKVEVTRPEVLGYRVFIIEPGTKAICAQSTPNGYQLPRVQVPAHLRRALALRSALKNDWKVQVFLLNSLNGSSGTLPMILAELTALEPTSELALIEPKLLRGDEIDEETNRAVHLSLDGKNTHSFSRVGWCGEATKWLEQSTSLNEVSKWRIEQYGAGGSFALVRFTTGSNQAYWLKATGEPNLHERAISVFLSKICRGQVPDVIASRDDWNAWIMHESALPSAECGSDALSFRQLSTVVDSMARLHVTATGREQALMQLGAVDQRLSVLLAHANDLFDFLEQAMQNQEIGRTERVSNSRLVELREIFKQACAWVEDLGIPNSIIQGDLNTGNLVETHDGYHFIDWAEAYVSNPLIMLEHLLLLHRPSDAKQKAEGDRALRARYAAAQREVCDPSLIEMAFAATPLLAAASTLYGRGDWIASDRRDDPRWQRFGRTLARYMDRAAASPELLATLSFGAQSRT